MASLLIEEENYVRISLLLTGVSPRAVRCLFDKDKDLAPAALPSTVQREKQKLFGLKVKKIINGAQWNMLHPANGIPDSNNFDVTLMICLLRNLTKIATPMFGFDCLPPPGETTEGADLARIKHYRNVLAHLDDTKIDAPTFTTAWNTVADAVGRLGGQHMLQECQELKVKILDQSNKEIILEIKQSQEEIKSLKQSNESLQMSHEGLQMSHEGLKKSHDIMQEEIKKEVKKHKSSHRKMKKLDQSNKEIMLEIKQSEEEIKNLKLSQEEIKNLKMSHEGLKRSHDIQQEEIKKEVKKHKSSHRKLKKSLQKDHENKQKEIDYLKEARDDPVPWNIRGQINKKMETWKKDNQMFVETRAAKRVLEYVKTESCVTVTGSSGMGKTFTVRHVALQMAGDGYDILPVTSPKDIEKYYNPNKKTLFVIDNFCGTYTLNRHFLDKWKLLSDTITDILEDKVTKIIVSCRLQVYQDELFKTLSLFTSCECNLMSEELCLLKTERQSLAKLYLKTEASKVREYLNLYDCFPLLCKLYSENQTFDVTEFFKNPFSVYEKEVDKLWTERAYGKYCALALCVMFNNHLKEEWLTEDIDKDMRTVIENTCEACKLDRGTSRLVIKDELESLNNTFIKKDVEVKSKHGSLVQIDMEDTTIKEEEAYFYCTVHDKLFDYLVSYFGNVMIPTLIKNGDNRLFAERIFFDSQDDSDLFSVNVPDAKQQMYLHSQGAFEKQNDSDQFTVIVPDKHQQVYLQRMIDDWVKGYVSHVFNNINMKKQTFRHIFMKCLTNLEPSFQKKLAENCDVLFDTRYGSYERINSFYYSWEDYSSTTPLIHCCYVGDIDMLQWFCDHGSDVNHCNSNGESALFMACRMGHTEVVNVLINNKANVNQCSKKGKSPLYKACEREYTEITTKLLDNKADVNQCTDKGESPLYIACLKGFSEIVTKLIDNQAPVYQCTNEGISPLYIACAGGFSKIVTKLLDSKADVDLCTGERESPLYIACRSGYTDLVKILLDKNANVNHCSNKGESPLFAACSIWSNLLDAICGHYIYLLHYKSGRKLEVNDETKERYSTVVKLLMNAGADYTLCNKDGKSPLDLFQQQDIIDMIKSWAQKEET